MTTQLNLSDYERGDAHARATDPRTSHEAAKVVRGDAATTLENMVIQALSAHPQGMTNHELSESTGIAWNTITPRVRPLVRKGLVVDSGIRRTGPTNRRCIVWKVKE